MSECNIFLSAYIRSFQQVFCYLVGHDILRQYVKQPSVSRRKQELVAMPQDVGDYGLDAQFTAFSFMLGELVVYHHLMCNVPHSSQCLV